MGFDSTRAEAFANDVDRDRAVYFAGRVDEIARFDERLAVLKSQTSAGHASSLAMVYQGAPGCGKTSLIDHLGKLHREVLFVRAEKRHLGDADSIMGRIRQVATESARMLGLGRRVVNLVAGAMRAKDLARSVNDLIGEVAAGKRCVVVHVDEAQTLDAKQEEGLLSMQQGTLDVPVLPVFTGLPHTEAALKAIPGMSRLAAGSVVNMSGLGADECADSTRSMLVSLGAIGDADSVDDASGYIAGLARGWPQHLNRAQAALCRELLRTAGRLREVDRGVVQEQANQARFAYYKGRLDDPVLGIRPGLAAALAARMDLDRAYDLMALTDLCAVEMNKLGIRPKRWFEAKDYVGAMIERGVLAQDDDALYGFAIPSMKDWLVATHGADGGR